MNERLPSPFRPRHQELLSGYCFGGRLGFLIDFVENPLHFLSLFKHISYLIFRQMFDSGKKKFFAASYTNKFIEFDLNGGIVAIG